MKKIKEEQKILGTGELAKTIAAMSDVKLYQAESMVSSLTTIITEALSQGYKVQITGFGSFEPKLKNARIGRNPHTGEAVPIKARIRPVFNPSQQLCDAVK